MQALVGDCSRKHRTFVLSSAYNRWTWGSARRCLPSPHSSTPPARPRAAFLMPQVSLPDIQGIQMHRGSNGLGGSNADHHTSFFAPLLPTFPNTVINGPLDKVYFGSKYMCLCGGDHLRKADTRLSDSLFLLPIPPTMYTFKYPIRPRSPSIQQASLCHATVEMMLSHGLCV
jgi:hypothetical protein